jgi:hypothetical protein
MPDTSDETNGKLIGFKNRRKELGDKRPLFQGKLTLPGTTQERTFALWTAVTKDGTQVLLSGRAGADAKTQIETIARPEMTLPPEAAIRIAQNGGKDLTIEPDAMVLFENKQKTKEHPTRPDYFGYFNPGKGERLVRLAIWTGMDRSGEAYIRGNLEFDAPTKDKERDKAVEGKGKAGKSDERMPAMASGKSRQYAR